MIVDINTREQAKVQAWSDFKEKTPSIIEYMLQTTTCSKNTLIQQESSLPSRDREYQGL